MGSTASLGCMKRSPGIFSSPSSLSCIFWKWLSSSIMIIPYRQLLHHASTPVLVTYCFPLPGGDHGFPLLLVCRPHHSFLVSLNSGGLVNGKCLVISMDVNISTMTDFKIPTWNYWMQYWKELHTISSCKLRWATSRLPPPLSILAPL